MASTEDPRESLMWEQELLVSSDELKAYAANYPPMGVYIPRGRVRVPHLRSRRIQQISQSARGKPNSPNLLMIKPNSLSQVAIKTLPSIDVYATRQCDVRTDMSRHPPTSSRQHGFDHRRKEARAKAAKSKMYDSMTSRLLYSGNDVSNGMAHYAKPFLTTNESLPPHPVQSVLPPPYVDPRMENVTSSSQNHDMTSFMTQDMRYPIGHQYYQHLSAIAAMAWSDCNQATEKLRRIYQETANLSRTYDPFGIFSGGIPGYHPHLFSASPATGNAASISGPKDPALPQSDLFSARYHQLAKDHQKYVNQTMSQNKYANVGANLNMHCDIKNIGQSNMLTSQSPLPGIALFNSQSSAQPHLNVPSDITNQRDYSRQSETFAPKATFSRQKRKLCDQQDLFAALGASCDQNYLAKLPKLDSAVHNFYPSSGNTAESQHLGDMTSLLPGVLRHPDSSQHPPPYESLLQNGLQNAIPDLLRKVGETKNVPMMNFSNMMGDDVRAEVTNTSSKLTDKLCLPSVSYSPTQSFPNLPYALQ